MDVSWRSAGPTGPFRFGTLHNGFCSHQLTNAPGKVYGFNFLADGKKLITRSVSDNVFHELDLTTGLEIQSWPAPAAFGKALCALTPDEGSFMAIGYEGGVVFRNLADQSQTKVDLDVLEAAGASFSPDGKLFAVASDLGYARVWDTATWRRVATSAAFSTGRIMCGFHQTANGWPLPATTRRPCGCTTRKAGRTCFTLEAPGTGFMGRVEFFPDNNTIAWVNQTTIYVWRAPSWAEINAAEAK